jgi:hypothetical protein
MALSNINSPKMVSVFLIFGWCCACSTPGRTDKTESVAGHLGYEGCRLSKPLTMAQVMAMDMSGGNGANRAHPDWDALIDKYAAGDQVYFVDCRKAERSSIVAGTTVYVLVRAGMVIARASDAMHE